MYTRQFCCKYENAKASQVKGKQVGLLRGAHLSVTRSSISHFPDQQAMTTIPLEASCFLIKMGLSLMKRKHRRNGLVKRLW